jgi:hypothetical protein
MMFFVLVAALGAFAHLVAAAQRPRISLFVAAILWAAYGIWEYYIATGVLCDKDCNIRVDLVFMFPILAIASWHAYQSYQEGPSQDLMIRGLILGATGLAILAGALWALGFYAWTAAAGIPALGLFIYAIKLKFAPAPM